MRIFSVLAIALFSACAFASGSDAKPFTTLCWGAGDWMGEYEFFADDSVQVSSVDSYSLSSELVSGSAKFYKDKVVVRWAGSKEEFKFDPLSKKVFPPAEAEPGVCPESASP